MKNVISEKLSILDQTQLLKYYGELSSEERRSLIDQIEHLDFSVLDENGAEEKRGKIEPIKAATLEEIEKNRDLYTHTGLKAIREGKVGAVLLAGGQGSRLGSDKPKGMFRIGVEKELYIFECLINNLLDVVKQANAIVPLFIMTSTDNDKQTREFLEEHKYFGYSPDNVFFFVQDQLPAVDMNGKLMLAEKGRVLTAPNGNGGWYSSLGKSGILNTIRAAKLEWLNVFAVDNVLQRIADPCFIGAVIESGKESGSKVVAKASPEERVGVMCLEDGRPSIVEYYEMTDAMRTEREADGTLSYNYGVILNYIFKTANLDRMLGLNLPLHQAFKKIPYIGENGERVVPEEPNAYKYETLVLDMVRHQDSCLPFEVVREREFAPVKNRTGVDSVDTARELLVKNGVVI